MTKRQAIMRLIHHAVSDCKGVGCGIRSLPSQQAIEELQAAILKVWPEPYPINWHNLGLPRPSWERRD